MGRDDTLYPDNKLIVQSVRKMWHEATMTPITLTADWYRLTSGSKVAASAVAADHLKLQGQRKLKVCKVSKLWFLILGTVEFY